MKITTLKTVVAAIGLLVCTVTVNAQKKKNNYVPLLETDKSVDFPKVGLKFWISADHVEQADGVVTILQDRSGNKNHARHDSGDGIIMINPIVLKDPGSGQPILRFSGDYCGFNFNQIADVRTGFCVISKDRKAFGALDEKCLLGGKISHDLHTGWTDDVIFNLTVNSGHLSQYAADGRQWLNGHPIQAQKTPWPKQLGLLSFTTTGPVSFDQIARDRNFDKRSWQGDIAEILLFNTVLSDADRTAVEQYLLNKYAIQPESPASDSAAQVINLKDSAAMVLVPSGKFLMGSKENQGQQGEYPQREVTLDAFFIYKYEVTVAQYRKFCGETHRAMPPEPPSKWQDNHPIANVMWDDANAYAAWAGATLPTEAQWEKAARGTDGRTFVWGESFTKSTCHTSDGKTAPVGSYPTGISPYGALDMTGNVWEWCADWYDPDYYAIAPSNNPPGPAKGTTRVLRGGSWGFNVAEFFKVAYRNRALPGCRYFDYGFRCAFLATKDGMPVKSAANQALTPVPMHTADWPQLGGPEANGISPETGINTDWTAHEPPVRWIFGMCDLGGYSNASIANGIVYILDHVGSKDMMRALDLNTGTQIWESGYEEASSPDYGFSRGCPVYAEGKLYTFSRIGNAACFDATTGKVLWLRNLQKEYDGKKADWGYSYSPTVDGKQVIYLPGGTNASVVALDKDSGATLWQSGSDAAGHATPVTATIHNVRQYVLFNVYGAVGVRASDGKQLWRHQWTTQHGCNALGPLIIGNKVFISSGYGVGCAMLDIDENWKVTEIWKNKELIARTARPIFYQGYIYGTDETARLVCLNAETGMMVWAKEGFGARINFAWKDGFACGSGGLLLVDGTLMVVSEATKSMVAVKATPNGYQELGRMKLLVNGNELFAPPAFSRGKLVVRDKKNLYCVDLLIGATTTVAKASEPVTVFNSPVISSEPTTSTAKVPGSTAEQSGLQRNWPQFLGPNGNGFSPNATAPIAWDEQTKAGVLWKVSIALPGYNSPIAWGHRIFIAGANADKREVYAYDSTNGKLIWTCPIGNLKNSPIKTADFSEGAGYAAPTLATDGQRVYAIFANGDLAAVNFNGTTLWSRNLGVPKNQYGHATSLAVWRDKLIVQWDQGGEIGSSRLMLLDGTTGKAEWEKARPVHNSWASPIVVEAAGKTQIITAALPWLASYAVTDGAELWKAGVLEGEITPSPIMAGGLVFCVNPAGKLIALRPDGVGDVTKTHIAWSSEEDVPDVTSPTSNGEIVFYVTSTGLGTCLDAKTGVKLWQHDFGTGIQASPAIAGNLIYVVSTDGRAWVFQAESEYKELGQGALKDKFYACPAFAGECLYLRGNTSLYCIGKK